MSSHNVQRPQANDGPPVAKYFFSFVVLSVLGVFVYVMTSPKPVAPAPLITAAGSVTHVDLHETSFSTSTSVVTTSGTYQVKGGVSATKGDEASLKVEHLVEHNNRERRSLCIKSSLKSACYELL